MNIGIIVHSYTGNTLSVAERIKSALEDKGHTVRVEKIKALNENPSVIKNIKLEYLPPVDAYDFLIFGGPVWAFSLSAPLKLYLNQLPELGGKKVGCYVTQQLPFEWLGGNRSIKQMAKILSKKNAHVVRTGVVSWSEKKRAASIEKAVNDFANLEI